MMKLAHSCYLLTFFLLMVSSACKKDDTGDGSGNGNNPALINYTLTAPSCLITTIQQTDQGAITLSYDSQKRLSLLSGLGDSLQVHYTYQSAVMTESTDFITATGTQHSEMTHYLNNAGMISHSVQIQTDGSKYEAFYTYTNDGYLMRMTTKYTSTSGNTSYNGTSYGYSQGNMTSQYDLDMDNQGNVLDSSLSSSLSYYMDKPGKLDVWKAWIARNGRPNANELKSQDNSVYTYEFGSNGFPLVVTETSGSYISVSNLTWNCN